MTTLRWTQEFLVGTGIPARVLRAERSKTMPLLQPSVHLHWRNLVDAEQKTQPHAQAFLVSARQHEHR